MATTRRSGKPYIFVTWLAKLLGGQQCVWSAWFKAHFNYQKYEEFAADLVKWNRDHTKLMAARQRALEADGWTCTSEDANSFKLEGASAVVAGKPDLVAVKGDRVLVVDGKTGRERDSDIWQVLLYLYAVPKARPDLPTDLEGEVFYKSGETVALTPGDLDADRMEQIVSLIRAIGSDTPPPKKPTRPECRVCNIGPTDCPQRVQDERTVAVGDF